MHVIDIVPTWALAAVANIITPPSVTTVANIVLTNRENRLIVGIFLSFNGMFALSWRTRAEDLLHERTQEEK